MNARTLGWAKPNSVLNHYNWENGGANRIFVLGSIGEQRLLDGSFRIQHQVCGRILIVSRPKTDSA